MSIPIKDLPLSTRIKNALGRAGITDSDQLRTGVEGLGWMEWHVFGKGSRDFCLRVLETIPDTRAHKPEQVAYTPMPTRVKSVELSCPLCGNIIDVEIHQTPRP